VRRDSESQTNKQTATFVLEKFGEMANIFNELTTNLTSTHRRRHSIQVVVDDGQKGCHNAVGGRGTISIAYYTFIIPFCC